MVRNEAITKFQLNRIRCNVVEIHAMFIAHIRRSNIVCGFFHGVRLGNFVDIVDPVYRIVARGMKLHRNLARKVSQPRNIIGSFPPKSLPFAPFSFIGIPIFQVVLKSSHAWCKKSPPLMEHWKSVRSSDILHNLRRWEPRDSVQCQHGKMKHQKKNTHPK